MENKIPVSFKLFDNTIKIVFDNERLNENKNYGESHYGSNIIKLSTTQGVKKLSEDTIIDTFFHELVHMILDHMRENELSGNEKFVEIFSKLLKQALYTFKWEDFIDALYEQHK